MHINLPSENDPNPADATTPSCKSNLKSEDFAGSTGMLSPSEVDALLRGVTGQMGGNLLTDGGGIRVPDERIPPDYYLPEDGEGVPNAERNLDTPETLAFIAWISSENTCLVRVADKNAAAALFAEFDRLLPGVSPAVCASLLAAHAANISRTRVWHGALGNSAVLVTEHDSSADAGVILETPPIRFPEHRCDSEDSENGFHPVLTIQLDEHDSAEAARRRIAESLRAAEEHREILAATTPAGTDRTRAQNI